MSIQRALDEIAFLAGELLAVRQAGFTEHALQFPRSEKGIIALCAFNNIPVEKVPRGWKYWPNAGMKAAWERVIKELEHA